MEPLDIVFAALCSIWVVQAALTTKNAGEIRTLMELDPPDLETWPRVSALVPSRNEAVKLRPALHSRLGDSYANLELIVVDDRSSDDTPDILRELAEHDPRLITTRIERLPEGWLGKINALQHGVERASGQWLLVSDADIEFTRGTLSRAVAICESEGIDFLALVPEFKSVSAVVDVVWAIFMRVFTMLVSPYAVRDPRRKAAAGSGSFMLLRREAFDKTEGFELLRMETGDDMALGMMMKQAGARCELMNGRGSVRISIYDSLAGFYRGVEKNAGTLSGVPLWIVVLLLFLALTVEFAPLGALLYTTLGPGADWLLGAGAAALTLQIYATAVPLRANNGRVWPAFLAPFGWLLMASGLLRSAVLGKIRGGVVWRGTFYSNAELKAGQRYKLL